MCIFNAQNSPFNPSKHAKTVLLVSIASTHSLTQLANMSEGFSSSSTLLTVKAPQQRSTDRSASYSPSPDSVGGRRWKKLRSTVIAAHLFKNPDVAVVNDLDELISDVQSLPFQQKACNKTDLTSAIDQHRSIQMLFQLCARGSADDLPVIDSLFKQDPRRYIRDHVDSQSLVNLKSPQGQTLIYQAAVNGSLPVVELLLAHGADAHLRSNVDGNESETPLDAACRWSHYRVVEALLISSSWSRKELLDAVKTASSGAIKVRLQREADRVKRRCLFCF